MNFEEFIKNVTAQLPLLLPEAYRDARIEINRGEKSTGSCTALTVRLDGQRMAPAVTLDYYYDRFRDGASWNDIMHQIAKSSLLPPDAPNLDLSWINDYSEVKTRLFVRLGNNRNIESISKNMPYRLFADLPVTYHILVHDDEQRRLSAPVTNEMMAGYGLSLDQLHRDALENAPKIIPGDVGFLSDILSDFIESAGIEINEADRQMAVITTVKGTDGASAILYPGVLENAAGFYRGDFYMIPCSLHEVILMPARPGIDIDRLSAVVREVNSYMLNEEDLLSDSVYRYDAKLGIMESAEQYEYRMRREQIPLKEASELGILDEVVIGDRIYTVTAMKDDSITVADTDLHDIIRTVTPEELDALTGAASVKGAETERPAEKTPPARI